MNKIKVNSLVKCKNNTSCVYLTLNKVYVVSELDGNYVHINDDRGIKGGYWVYRFKLIPSKAARVLYGN